MNEKKDIEYYMNLPYNTVLKKLDDKYYFFIPDLQIISKGNTVNEAYEMLEKDKGSYFNSIIKLNEHDIVKIPKSLASQTEGLFAGIAPFFIKTILIIVLLFAVLGTVIPFTFRTASDFAVNNFSLYLKKAANKCEVLLETRIQNHVQKYSNLSDKEKEIIKENIRVYIENIKPT